MSEFLEEIKKRGRGALDEKMGIEIVEASPQRLVATMPVAGNTQPMGLLHGGANVVLAESLGSIGTQLHAGRDRRIVGVDINEKLLEIAKKRNPNEKTIYDTSTEAHSGFDFIFCMTVLCSYPKTLNLKNCGEVYPFSKFEEAVLSLVGKLNDGGSIIICNSNFRFADVSCASSFESISVERKRSIINVPKFDNQNNICEEDYPFCIFKKIK